MLGACDGQRGRKRRTIPPFTRSTKTYDATVCSIALALPSLPSLPPPQVRVWREEWAVPLQRSLWFQFRAKLLGARPGPVRTVVAGMVGLIGEGWIRVNTTNSMVHLSSRHMRVSHLLPIPAHPRWCPPFPVSGPVPISDPSSLLPAPSCLSAQLPAPSSPSAHMAGQFRCPCSALRTRVHHL